MQILHLFNQTIKSAEVIYDNVLGIETRFSDAQAFSIVHILEHGFGLIGLFEVIIGLIWGIPGFLVPF